MQFNLKKGLTTLGHFQTLSGKLVPDICKVEGSIISKLKSKSKVYLD